MYDLTTRTKLFYYRAAFLSANLNGLGTPPTATLYRLALASSIPHVESALFRFSRGTYERTRSLCWPPLGAIFKSPLFFFTAFPGRPSFDVIDEGVIRPPRFFLFQPSPSQPWISVFVHTLLSVTPFLGNGSLSRIVIARVGCYFLPVSLIHLLSSIPSAAHFVLFLITFLPPPCLLDP